MNKDTSAATEEPDRTGVYRFTSIARPIDPVYLSNKALLMILPAVGVVNAVLAAVVELGTTPLASGISGVLVALVAWVLARELAPDQVDASFVALALAWAASLALGTDQVLMVFAAILLLRVVNRSTGLPLTWFDTISVFGFCSYTAMQTQQPLIILVMALVFVADALLEKPLRRHFVAAGLCLPVFAWMLVGDASFAIASLEPLDWLLLGGFALGTGLVVSSSGTPISYADTSYTRLSKARVNAGFMIGGLMAAQAVITDGRAGWFDTPLWACLLAVFASLSVSRLRDWTER